MSIQIKCLLMGILIWLTSVCNLAGGAARNSDYACEKMFTFGLWACEPRAYDLGLEGLLRDMRRHFMNCMVAGPGLGKGPEDISRLKQDIALCRRYGVFVLPAANNTNYRFNPAVLRSVAEVLKDEPAVLGWYIRDEPNPDFLPYGRARDVHWTR